MNLNKYILYATKLCNDFDIPVGKTMIQKIMYFTFTKKNEIPFTAYLYGPYSDYVQLTTENLLQSEQLQIDYVKKTFVLSDTNSDQEQDEYIDAIKKIITFFKQYKSLKLNSAKNIAQLAKVHMLRNKYKEMSDKQLAERIKKESKFCGWSELTQMSINDLLIYIKAVKELDPALH